MFEALNFHAFKPLTFMFQTLNVMYKALKNSKIIKENGEP